MTHSITTKTAEVRLQNIEKHRVAVTKKYEKVFKKQFKQYLKKPFVLVDAFQHAKVTTDDIHELYELIDALIACRYGQTNYNRGLPVSVALMNKNTHFNPLVHDGMMPVSLETAVNGPAYSVKALLDSIEVIQANIYRLSQLSHTLTIQYQRRLEEMQSKDTEL